MPAFSRECLDGAGKMFGFKKKNKSLNEAGFSMTGEAVAAALKRHQEQEEFYFQEISRYGDLQYDRQVENQTGAYRYMIWWYEDHEYFVEMKNGCVMDLKMIGQTGSGQQSDLMKIYEVSKDVCLDKIANMDTGLLFNELDDTIQFDILGPNGARWIHDMPRQKAVYLAIIEELKKRIG